MDSATVQIPQDIIEPIIQARVQAAVIAALDEGGAQKLIERAVSAVLTEKVGIDGKKPSYASSSDVPWLNWLMQDCLKRTVRKIIEDEIPKHEEAIRAYLVKELQRKNSPLLKQFVEGLIGKLTDPYNFKYNLTVAISDR